VLPFFHSYGYFVYLGNALWNGSHTLCIPKFDGDLFLNSIRRHRPTGLHLVPPLMSLINNAKDFGRKELEWVEIAWIGAAPAGKTLISALSDKIGKDYYFVEGYGMTELSPREMSNHSYNFQFCETKIITKLDPPPLVWISQIPFFTVSHAMIPSLKDPLIGSCGVPVPNTLTKIVDVETGKAVGRNLRGELHIKGPQVRSNVVLITFQQLYWTVPLNPSRLWKDTLTMRRLRDIRSMRMDGFTRVTLLTMMTVGIAILSIESRNLSKSKASK